MRDPTDFSLTRRRLLAALASAPLLLHSGGVHAATPPDPRRIIALEWLPVELLMALGVMPMAIADIPNYRMWVSAPPLPDDIIDVGLRTEPNLELMEQLKPSLILYSAGYGPAAAKITRIAPGLGFNFSDPSGKPLDVARRSLRQLGDTLGLQSAAEQHLAEFDAFMAAMKPHFAWRGSRPVLLMTFLDNRHALVVGRNSLFQQVMDLLGIANAWQGETNFWGTAIVGLERLAVLKEADVLCLDHNNETIARQVLSTPLWQALPFVRAGRFRRAPAVWLYGATFSAMRITRILDDALGRPS